jgi:hypothetical protein
MEIIVIAAAVRGPAPPLTVYSSRTWWKVQKGSRRRFYLWANIISLVSG